MPGSGTIHRARRPSRVVIRRWRTDATRSCPGGSSWGIRRTVGLIPVSECTSLPARLCLLKPNVLRQPGSRGDPSPPEALPRLTAGHNGLPLCGTGVGDSSTRTACFAIPAGLVRASGTLSALGHAPFQIVPGPPAAAGDCVVFFGPPAPPDQGYPWTRFTTRNESSPPHHPADTPDRRPQGQNAKRPHGGDSTVRSLGAVTHSAESQAEGHWPAGRTRAAISE